MVPCFSIWCDQGVTRTANRLRRFVWWPGLQSDVVAYLNACPVCCALKSLRSAGGITGALEVKTLFSIVSMDFVGPRRYGQITFHLAVMVDHYTRFMVCVLLEEASSQSAIDSLQQHWIAKFGTPRAILTDRGAQFTSTKFKTYVAKYLQCRHYFASTEYPQGNGVNESSHRILETAIKTSPGSRVRPLSDLITEATLLYKSYHWRHPFISSVWL